MKPKVIYLTLILALFCFTEVFSRSCSNIIIDGDSLWLATAGNGLVKYNKKTGKSVIYNQANAGLPKDVIASIAKDKEGNIWLMCGPYGVGKFDGNRCQVYTPFYSELFNWHLCTTIAIDADNNKWLGPLGGIVRFDGNEWSSWELPNTGDASDWHIFSLKFDTQGVLWIGGRFLRRNFFKYSDGIVTEIVPSRELLLYSVYAIEIDADNNKWLGTNRGLLKYDGEGYTAYTTSNTTIPFNKVEDIKKDAEGNLWLAGGRYLTKFDGTDFISYENPLLGVADYHCLEHDDDGSIWLYSPQKTLFHFKDGQFESINYSGQGQSIDTVINDGEPVAVYYYNLQGLAVSQPAKGRVYIAKEVYQSGAVRIKKIMK